MPERLTRRGFLIFLSLFISACSKTELVESESEETTANSTSPEVKVARLSELQEGVNVLTLERVILVRNGDSLSAMSLVCTHQQCLLVAEAEGYRCPCHGARFSAEGEVLRGPATEPLRVLPVRIDDAGGVFVTFQEN